MPGTRKPRTPKTRIIFKITEIIYLHYYAKYCSLYLVFIRKGYKMDTLELDHKSATRREIEKRFEFLTICGEACIEPSIAMENPNIEFNYAIGNLDAVRDHIEWDF